MTQYETKIVQYLNEAHYRFGLEPKRNPGG